MIAIELDAGHQNRLNALAAAQGEDGATFARRVLLDYLDFQALPTDSDAAWGQASIALTPEIMEPENWDDTRHGPQ